MPIDRKVASLISGAALAASLGLAKVVKGEEYKADGWPTPNINTATFIEEKKKDIITDIPGAETTLRIYKTPQGTYFNTLSINGKLYGFYVDTDGKPPMEYTLIDQDGDGVYRYKSSNERPLTPHYLKSGISSKK